jgi:serine/threonine-protein phosphatase PGAM5
MSNQKLLLLNLLLLILFLFVSTSLCQTSETKQKGTRTIYLIRHGEYNIDDERDAFVGKELTPLGVAQARLLSTRLKAMSVHFNSLISSTMTRARQTAMVINQEFPELELKQDSLICECTPPTWREDIMAGVDTTEKEQCVANIEEAFSKYFVPSPDEKDRHDLIVCHGNVIRYLVTKVLNVDTMSWLQMSITNCSLTIVRIKHDGTMKLDTFSDYGHIPENMRTFTGGENELKELVIPSTK